MYKEFSVKQTEEINQFKFYADEFTLNIRDYHMKNKELYEIQCINFKSCLEILKVIYSILKHISFLPIIGLLS